MEFLKNKVYTILRKSERYTKTDMVYLIKGTAWSGAGVVTTYTLSFASLLAFANLLPKETYGTYQYILSIADLCGIFVLSGIDTAVTRSVARGTEGTVYKAFATKIRWGLLGGLASLIISTYYFSQGNTLLGNAFLISAIAIPFWEAPGIYATYLQGKKRFDLINIYPVLSQLMATAIIIGALFITTNILVILAAYYIGWGLGSYFFFIITFKKNPPNDKEDPELIPYGKHLTVMQAPALASMVADKMLVWQLLGPVAVAVYIFAQNIPLKVASIIKIFNRLAFPKMAMQEFSVIKKTLPKKVLLLFVFSLAGAILYALVAPFLFSLFFPQYMEAVPFTQLASILIALQPFGLFHSALSAQAKKKSLYVLSLGNPIIRIAVFATLIPLWGLWGAIWGLIIAKSVESILATWFFYRS